MANSGATRAGADGGQVVLVCDLHDSRGHLQRIDGYAAVAQPPRSANCRMPRKRSSVAGV